MQRIKKMCSVYMYKAHVDLFRLNAAIAVSRKYFIEKNLTQMLFGAIYMLKTIGPLYSLYFPGDL